MSYVDGFVAAVPTENKERYVEHARLAGEVFIEHGALRLMDCWGDDIPRGTMTDFYRAVAAAPGETVVFSWIEWPDKATRDRCMSRIAELMETEPRFRDNPMPFDGKRMIFGGFEPLGHD